MILIVAFIGFDLMLMGANDGIRFNKNGNNYTKCTLTLVLACMTRSATAYVGMWH